ncbi:MAG: hypothetical protein R8K53_07400 [Mariprofundaceae bacterium]
MTTKLVQYLNEAGLDMMQLSVDSVHPGDKSMKSLKSLMPKLHLLAEKARFSVKVQTVLTEDTAQQYSEFRGLLKAFHFDFSFSLLHQTGGRIAVQGEALAELLHRHDLWGGMCLYREDAEALLLGDLSRPWHCLGGFKFLYVNADGMIQWCSQQQESLQPLQTATRNTLKANGGHKPCEAGCAIGCARLVSHSLAHPLKSFKASLASIPEAVGSK